MNTQFITLGAQEVRKFAVDEMRLMSEMLPPAVPYLANRSHM